MRCLFALGTRPEVIKLAPVIHATKACGHEVSVLFTGQHRDLVLPLLRFFEIEPDYQLEVMAPGQTLTSLSQRILANLEDRSDDLRSDYILIQGDTTTAFVVAYWGFCRRIPVAYVEAGLRTYNLSAPFPEEANRQLITRIASLHFAPTPSSARALAAERVGAERTYVVGNPGIDALYYTLGRLKGGEAPAGEALSAKIRDFYAGRKLVVVTAHRRESFGAGFERIGGRRGRIPTGTVARPRASSPF